MARVLFKIVLSCTLILIFMLQSPGELFAQNGNEGYNDLHGFEKADGSTQLYFRVYNTQSFTCTIYEGDPFQSHNTFNHMYRLSQNSELTRVLSDYIYGGCVNDGAKGINDFKVINDERDIILDVGINSLMEYDGYFHFIEDGVPDQERTLSIWLTEFISVERPADSVIVIGGELVNDQNFTLVSYDNGFTWNVDLDKWPTEDMEFDSTLWNFTMLSIQSDDQIWGYRQGQLVISDDFGNSHQVIDSTYQWHKNSRILYSDSPDTVFALSRQNRCDDFGNTPCYRLFSIAKSGEIHQVDNIRSYKDPIFVSSDTVNGELHYATGDKIFRSPDYGQTFESVLELDDDLHLTGIYKKPAADSLYILTRNELFLYSGNQLTSLRKRSVVSIDEPDHLPGETTLFQNYPNPFNPATTIRFELPSASAVTLEVFDLLGRRVSMLVNETKNAGLHEITFDASGLSGGMYYYRLQTSDFTKTRPMLLLK